MSKITQAKMDDAQKKLRDIVNTAIQIRDHCCATHQCEARDKASMVLSHLAAAESVAGSMKMWGDDGPISPRSGGSK